MHIFRIIESRIRFIVCNDVVMRSIYGILTILGCAWTYATMFSIAALLTGNLSEIPYIWYISTKIAFPFALLVGYMAYSEVPMEPR
jgi:hypothetical protein